MGHEHGVFHLPPGFVFADDPPLSGTIDTPNGAIKWSRSSDGSVAADYGDQRFTATYVESTNGDWTRRAAFMRAGQAYLVLEAAVDHGHGVAHATIEAGQSSLTLAVSAIDPAGQSGTATLSGDIPEANVGWTGPVDLASNPLLGTAIPGLPRNTFDAEFKMAAVFWPLIGAMVQPPAPGGTAIGHASFGGASTGTGGHIIMEDKTVGGVLEHAGAWCAGGAIAGSKGFTFVGMGLGCAGGAVASFAVDIYDWFTEPDVPIDPPPPLDAPIPSDSESPYWPHGDEQHDDPPPPPHDSGSGQDSDGSGDTGSTDTGTGDDEEYAGGDEGGDGSGGGGFFDPDDPGHKQV